MRLGHHELANIRLRHQLRETTLEDVEALLDEIDQLVADVGAIGGQVAERLARAPTWEVAEALRERLEEGAEAEGSIREHEAFERGVGALVACMRADDEVRDALLSEARLASPDEFCRNCSAGHADECGFCDHGKKVRGLWVETTGPTRTGLIVLVVLWLPLVEVLGDAQRGGLARDNRRARVVRDLLGRRKDYLLARLLAAGGSPSSELTRQQLAERIAAAEVK